MSLIYIIEDDAVLRTELSRTLELQGYEVVARESFRIDLHPNEASVELAAAALGESPSCVLLDLHLPGTDGHGVCRALREKSDVPIIILTCSDAEFDEVMGIGLGADDYVTKPYSPAVLLARIQSVLRRSASDLHRMSIAVGGVVLDLSDGTVSFEGVSTELSRNEMRILRLLMCSPGMVVTRQEIICDLWESDSFIDDNTLTVNVNRLRKTLSSIGVPDQFLSTRRGVGYQVMP